MVGPNLLQEQTAYLLEANLGLLKFMFTLAKPGYEGRVSSKKTSIPANRTGASFYFKVNYSVYKAVSRDI